jgi:hypothetical protein
MMACIPDKPSPPGTDTRLLPFLNAGTEAEAERALRSLLLSYAEPIIDGVIRRYWRGPPGPFETEERTIADNARSDILYETVRRLRLVRTGAQCTPIADFPAYIAVTAFHVCDHALRHIRPERYRLKLHIRTLLSETPGLALWDDDGTRIAGFAAWQAQSRHPDSQRVRAVFEGEMTTQALERSGLDPSGAPVAKVVAHLMDAAGCPIPWEDLVDLTAQALGIHEPATVSLSVDSDRGERELDMEDSAPSVESRVELREYLLRMWREICALPVRQRNALLLNLRGDHGSDGVDLFPLSHIASKEEVAGALELAPHELSDLWDNLPLDDEAIAGRLGCTRAQVIGLRNAARNRLHRRMLAS